MTTAEQRAHNHRVMTSTGNNEWRTPQYIFDWLNEQYGPFTLDAAASPENHLCPHYFTLEHSAMEHDWVLPDGRPANTFVNPPFGKFPKGHPQGGKSQQGPFFHRAWQQAQAYGVTSTLFVPVKTDTDWWHEVVRVGAACVLLLRGRITFTRADGSPEPNPATFPMCVVRITPGVGESGPAFIFTTPPSDPRRRRKERS